VFESMAGLLLDELDRHRCADRKISEHVCQGLDGERGFERLLGVQSMSFLSDEKICRRGVFGASGELLTDVTVNSPMLIPGGSASFIIKEVIHPQSSAEGTTTDILITNENGLGSESLKGAA
jgi:hypothetical protein